MSVERVSIRQLSHLLNEINSTANILNNLNENKNAIAHRSQVNQLVKNLIKFNETVEKNRLNFLVEKGQILGKMDKSLEQALKAVALFQSNSTQNLPPQKNFAQIIFGMINHLAEEMRKLGKNLRELKDRKDIKVGKKVEASGASKKSKEKK